MSNISLPPRPIYPDNEFHAVPAVPPAQLTIFSDLARAVRRYRGAGACVFTTCMAATLYVALQQQPVYPAEASIRLNSRESRIDRLQSTTDTLLTGNISDVSVIRTEVEVLQSRDLIGRVVDELKLAVPDASGGKPGLVTALTSTARDIWSEARSVALPLLEELGFEPDEHAAAPSATVPPTAEMAARDDAIIEIMKRLQVESVANSFLVSVRYRNADPATAAAVVNKLVELYAANQKNAKEELARNASVWLEEQLEKTRKNLLDSEQEVTRFREANGLSEMNGLTVMTQQILDTTKDLNAVNTQIQQLQAEVREIERARTDPTNQVSATRFLESPIIQKLMEEDSELARDEAEKNSVFGPNHPAIRDLQSRRRTMQTRIQREIDAIARATARSLTAARAQAAALQGRLNQWSKQQGQSAGAIATLRDLEQTASVNRTQYNDLLREYRDLGTRERQQMSDITIVAKAQPAVRGKTGKTLIVAGGLIGALSLALFTVLGLAWWRNGVFDPRQLAQRTGVRSLGFMPELKKSRRRRFLANSGKTDPAIMDASLAIVHSLAVSGARGQAESVMVTSAVPDEGKTFTAIALARVIALSGRRTLLIDMDCRRQAVEEAVAGDIVSRSTATLQAGLSESDFIMAQSRTELLHYLFLGKAGRNAGMLKAQDLRYLLQSARQQYDVLIIDSPPVLAASEAMALGRMVDRTLFTVRWERTNEQMVINSFEAVRGAGVAVDGFILSRVDLAKHARYKLKDRTAMFRKYAAHYAQKTATYIGS
jgi:uncharacterized protein involved in exopolysaccharide biosynthesis